MGVSGAGKTTVGRLIGKRLGADFLEGDSFHPPANVEKMRRELPLDDEDRAPWLAALASELGRYAARRQSVVLACSALKRRYRDVLRSGAPSLRLVHLKGTRAQIEARLAARIGHYMPPTLLPSQFAALEEPGADERAIVVEISETPAAIADRVLGLLIEAASDEVA